MTPELLTYIESHTSAQPQYLSDIERDVNQHLLNGRMCSGFLQGRLLKMLTSMIKPKNVLELGTFAGFSTLCIAEALDKDAHIDTIEIDDELEDYILANFEKSPFANRITLHIGEAEKIMANMQSESYDMIFMDADKRRYAEDFRMAIPLLRKGGYIIADNTLWDGHVVNPAKEKDPQTAGIKIFNDMTASHPELETIILPMRDGLTLIRKSEQPQLNE